MAAVVAAGSGSSSWHCAGIVCSIAVAAPLGLCPGDCGKLPDVDYMCASACLLSCCSCDARLLNSWQLRDVPQALWRMLHNQMSKVEAAGLLRLFDIAFVGSLVRSWLVAGCVPVCQRGTTTVPYMMLRSMRPYMHMCAVQPTQL